MQQQQYQQSVDLTHSDLQAEIAAINKEIKRWERKRLRLQQQLAHAQTATPASEAAHTNTNNTVATATATSTVSGSDGRSGAADVVVQPPPYKRRVVLRGGVQEAITKLQSAPHKDEHNNNTPHTTDTPQPAHTTTTAPSPTAAAAVQAPASSTSTASVDRVRNRRMFAGLLSHLSAASTTLSRDRPTLAQQQRLQQPAAQHNTTQQLNDALSRCQQVEAALLKKHIELRRRSMHGLYQQTEQWKDDWLWTADDGSEQQPCIAWRVREMTQVWQVVRDEEAKQSRERRRKARMMHGEEDEEVVEARKRSEGWSEEDESRLLRLIQQELDSRQESFPTPAPDRGRDDSSGSARPQQSVQQTSFYRDPARRRQPLQHNRRSDSSREPADEWQHSNVGNRRDSGERQRDTGESYKGDGGSKYADSNKRRRDSVENDRDGRRSRMSHRRSSVEVDEFGRNVHDEDWSTAVEEETGEARMAREKAEKFRDEETERLLHGE